MWHLPSLPHIYSSFFFYKFATYLQGENLCKSILGLWYFQGYMFQPGIYGIIKGLFFNVKLTPNRYILHVPEGYRVISFLIWLFRSLHKITILHVLKERKNCTESAFEIFSISCIVITMQESGVWRHFGDLLSQFLISACGHLGFSRRGQPMILDEICSMFVWNS